MEDYCPGCRRLITDEEIYAAEFEDLLFRDADDRQWHKGCAQMELATVEFTWLE